MHGIEPIQLVQKGGGMYIVVSNTKQFSSLPRKCCEKATKKKTLNDCRRKSDSCFLLVLVDAHSQTYNSHVSRQNTSTITLTQNSICHLPLLRVNCQTRIRWSSHAGCVLSWQRTRVECFRKFVVKKNH